MNKTIVRKGLGDNYRHRKVCNERRESLGGAGCGWMPRYASSDVCVSKAKRDLLLTVVA